MEGREGRLVLEARPHLGIPALYVHDLTGTRDAERLLPSFPNIHPHSSKVLPRLRQWNPELAAQFEEKEPVKKMPFKLITTSQHWSSETRDYGAISYCWHGEDWEIPSRFYLDEKDWDFPITPIMLQGILRDWDVYWNHNVPSDAEIHPFTIWIDQLCINQQDAEEKFHAIANMDTIYQNASYVCIILEDLDFTPLEDSAFETWFRGDDSWTGRNPPRRKLRHEDWVKSSTQITHLFSALYRIYRSRWFKRAWCRQEFLLQLHRHLFIATKKRGCGLYDMGEIEKFRQDSYDKLKNMLPSGFHEKEKTIEKYMGFTVLGLRHCFVRLESLQCTWRKDIISIALNTSGIRLSFKGDNPKRDYSRYILAMVALGAGDTYVLGDAAPPTFRPVGQFLLWPPNNLIGEGLLRLYCKETKIPDEAKIWALGLQSIVLGAFMLTYKPSASPRRWESIADALVNKLVSPDSDIITNIRSKDTLVSILDLGFKWVLWVYQYLEPIILRDFFATLIDLQAEVVRNSNNEVWSLLPEDFSAADRDSVAKFIWMVTRLLHFTSRYQDLIPLVTTLDSAKQEKAILIVPKFLVPGICESKYTLVMPAALNNPTAVPITRVWILEKARTKGVGFVRVGNGLFIGRELKAEEQDHVEYLERVTITGAGCEEPHSNSGSTADG